MGIDKAVKGEIYDSLRKELSKPVKRGQKTWTEDFVQNMLAEARKDPNSPFAALIAKAIMTPDILDRLDADADRLILRDKEFAEYRVFKQLYKEQREVAYDKFIDRKCIVTSRRSGKTNLAARLLVDYCIEPMTPVLYIHTKADNCLSQCWPLVIQCCKDIELGIKRADKGSMRIEFANGSSIQMFGNKDKASAQFLRGSKYKLIICDESQSLRNMEELIEDVCEPMLMDYPNSCLILQGTPPRMPNTYFEKAWNSPKWTNYHWDARKNPFLNDVEGYIKKLCETKGITEDNSLIQREYYGNFVYDHEAQVMANYKVYTEEKELANISPSYIVIGEDFGFADYNAIIGFAVDVAKRKAYCYFEWKQNKVGSTEIIAATKSAYDMGLDILRKSGINPDGRIKIFGDNSDGTLLYEMRKRHGLPTFNAYKFDKIEGIAKFSERSSVGDYLIPKDGILEEEYQKILYKRDEETDDITAELDDELFHPDAFYAALYASRFIEQLYLQDGEALEDYVPVAVAERVAIAADDVPPTLKQNMLNQSQKRSSFNF